MKKFAFAFLLIGACSRDEASRPAETATTIVTESSSTTGSPVDSTTAPTPPTAPPVTGPKLAFVDKGANDPGFAAYRAELLAAIRARDAKKVVALADPHIKLSFSGAGGSAAFEEALKEEIWGELETIVTMGGSYRDGNSFWAPYVYSEWPEAHDSFEELAVVADDVPLRESADANATAIATLSRDIVKRAGQPGDRGPWTKVTTADGKTGFVESKHVRSPIDYRAGFNQTGTVWRMTALVAGD